MKSTIQWESRLGSGHYNRRMLEVSLFDDKDSVVGRSTLVSYPSPDSKKNDIAVSTDAHKVKQVQFISRDKLLFCFEQIYFAKQGDKASKQASDYYWSIMFKNGQIQNEIPFNTDGYTSA